ncbi:LytR/AlgR family response regulator transcription factor [Hymenobacter canadensis]|uniref:LytTR family DNA-binding domain-containing protein n=1 Tax=Hymenobacter canadensis TaxID=2999067 RepID=A0ABY7LYW2_9BACT|nr:LytTR family DNA-binding domain-containing protein [Hymenobacter canadensis]WBA44138.1 LytTR family DNA-binding domain-containing protein [Hymenobacter canadensis]
MQVLIIEDEYAAARSLQRLLSEVRPQAQVLDQLESVVDAVAWLAANPAPELIFMDIHLADGSSFEIFRRTTVTSPVIFVTAFDEHALEAFRANGIDYLLKPLTRADLQRSLDKFDALRQSPPPGVAPPAPAGPPVPDFAQLLRSVQQQLNGGAAAYKSSWLIPHKTKLIPVATADVAYFAIRHGLVFLTTLTGQEYQMEHPLDELESQVDPRLFFRANRQVLFARPSLVALEPYFNGRMQLYLRPESREEVIVSKPKVTELKNWVAGG